MAKINGVEVLLDIFDFDIMKLNPIIRLEQDIGFSAPLLVINVQIPSSISVKNLKVGKEFNLTIDSKVYNFYVVNFTKLGSSYNIISYLNVMDFMEKNNQFSNEDTFIETVKKITSIKIDTKSSSSDKQIWIQDNITDKDFIKQSILHSKTDSLLLTSIQLDKILKLITYNEILQGKEIQLSHQSTSGISFESIDVESTPVSFTRQVNAKLGIITQPAYIDEYKNNTEVSDISKINRVSIDAGNVYLDYYKSFVENQINYAKLLSKLLSTTTNTINSFKPLDLIILKSVAEQSSLKDDFDFLNKKFVVIRVVTDISANKATQKIYFSRIES